MDNRRLSCSCARQLARRTAKSTATFSIVENKRVADGRVVQRHVLYQGEIRSSQQLAWRKSIEVFEDGREQPSTLSFVSRRSLRSGDC
jgi:hypothetical protein